MSQTDKEKQYQQRYYHKNREKRLSQCKEYQRKNREKKIAYMRAYYRANPDKFNRKDPQSKKRRNETRRKFYAENPHARIRAIADAKAYRIKKPHKRSDQTLKRLGQKFTYYEALENQGKCCAICSRKQNKDSHKFKFFHIDHCHFTGKFRGLLCSSCNLGLGKFQDSPELLELAAAYIRKFRG